MYQSFSPFGQIQGLGSLLQGQMFAPPQLLNAYRVTVVG